MGSARPSATVSSRTPKKFRSMSTASTLCVEHPAPLLAREDPRRVPALRGAARRFALGADLRLRAEYGREDGSHRERENQTSQAGRLVAGALPATRRELPSSAREGS